MAVSHFTDDVMRLSLIISLNDGNVHGSKAVEMVMFEGKMSYWDRSIKDGISDRSGDLLMLKPWFGWY